MARRLKLITLTNEAACIALNRVLQSSIPDARIVNARIDYPDRVQFVVESDSFEEVGEGESIPELER